MTIKELIELERFEVLSKGDNLEEEILLPFCCDLLSVAMSKAPSKCAWVTVMGNINTLAVASLTDSACIILAEGAKLDEVAKNKALEEGITVFCTEKPIYETAKLIDRLL